MATDVVIVSGARTPIGRLGGAFKDMRGSTLGAIAIRAAVERAGIAPEQVDEVIMGNVLQAAESGYAAGILNSLDLLDAERVLLEVRTGTERARADHAIALARLEGTIGGPLGSETEGVK